jgi:hypothetical protein
MSLKYKLLVILMLFFSSCTKEDIKKDGLVYSLGFNSCMTNESSESMIMEASPCTINHEDFEKSFIIPLDEKKIHFDKGAIRAKIVFENNESYLIDNHGIVKSNDLRYGLINDRVLYAYLIGVNSFGNCRKERVFGSHNGTFGLAKAYKKHYPEMKVIWIDPITKKQEEIK